MSIQTNYISTSDGEKIFYRYHPAKEPSDLPPLVFNYGLVCSMHHWSLQIPYFKNLNFPVVEYDYRGHFQSSGKEVPEKITFERMAYDIQELLDILEFKQAVLLGHSMGVNVVLEAARLIPNRVAGLVVISGTVFPVTNVMFDSNMMEFLLPILKKGLDKYPVVFEKIWKSTSSNPLIKKIIHHQGFNVKNVSSAFIDVYINRVAQLGPSLFFQLFQEMIAQDILSDLTFIKCPTLVMGGLKDKVIPNYLQRLLAEQIKGSETYFFADGSHVPQVDYPEWTNERIKIFIENHFIQKRINPEAPLTA